MTQVAKQPQNDKIVDLVIGKLNTLAKEGMLELPPGYSHANALKSAFLILQNTKNMSGKPVLESCNQPSIINCLFDMAIQGLSAAKKQCYFIAYGDNLTLSRSYFGTMAVTKRIANVDIQPQIIYKDDEFEMELDHTTGVHKITKHKQSFESLGTEIKGAYCIITHPNGKKHIEVMNMRQITSAWNMRKGNGLSPAHKNFEDQMVKKTVIQRACKYILNTSDDNDLIIEAANRSDDSEMDFSKENEVAVEISESANVVSLEDAIVEAEKEVDISESKLAKEEAEERTENIQDGDDTVDPSGEIVEEQQKLFSVEEDPNEF